jgi:hypothetical protein
MVRPRWLLLLAAILAAVFVGLSLLLPSDFRWSELVNSHLLCWTTPTDPIPKSKKTVTWGASQVYEPAALTESQKGTERDTLVLDLDETLVHSVPQGDGEFEVLVRPGADAFLAAMAAKFDLVVFTASTQPYADPILDSFASLPRSAPRYYRDACTWAPELGLFVKDLRILGLPLDRVRILDNTPQAYSMQPQCGVPIVSWTGDPHDRELEKTALSLSLSL